MEEISVLNLFLQAGIVVKVVMILLFMASILSWIVIVERYKFFRKVKNENNTFLKKFWSGKDLSTLHKESMRVSIASDEEEMNKHLPFLANVGSVSPYVGLLGTVWGIMTSFQGLSDATQATINAVAPGISEALIATGMGLFAAIPAVVAFNKFTAESETISQNTLIFAEEMASIFYKKTFKKQ